MIYLRPHHLLCIQYFIGHGYSKEFVENMKKTILELKKDNSFTLVCNPDSLCKSCPNLKNGICSSQKKVQGFDQRMIELFFLEENKEYNYQEMKSQVVKFLKDGKRSLVCENCEWASLCVNKKEK